MMELLRRGPFSHPREGQWGHAVRAPVRGAGVLAQQYCAGLASPAGLARALSAPASSPEPRAPSRWKNKGFLELGLDVQGIRDARLSQ